MSAGLRDALRERIGVLWRRGLTVAEIAERTGTTRNTIMGLVARMNLPRRRGTGPRAGLPRPARTTGDESW